MEQDPQNTAAFAIFQLAKERILPETARIKEHLAQQRPDVPHNAQEWAASQSRQPTAAFADVHAAMQSRQKGDLTAALRYADAAIAADTRDPMAHLQRALVNHELNRFPEALVDLDHALDMGWSDQETYLLRSKMLMQKKAYEAALQDARMAVRLNAGSAAAIFARAAAMLELHRQRGDLPNFRDEILKDLQSSAAMDAKYKPDLDSFAAEIAAQQLPPSEEAAAKAKAERSRRSSFLWLGSLILGALGFLIYRRSKEE
jgi:regulator of sirC expression with transglutaminase-like and TPR domain